MSHPLIEVLFEDDMNKKPATFADRLKDARSAAGLSQPALAGLAGVPLATLRSLEQGQRKEVWLSTARKLALALNVTLDQLANG